jgi:Zn-dependent protease with chaperone function
MASALPDSIEPYENISSKAYEHPADRAATAALKAVPMLDTVVRKLVEWRYERALRQFFLGNSVKVGEHQLPDLWTAHIGVCRILDMERYDLYVSADVRGGAQAIGSGKPMIVVDSQLLQCLGPGEQRAVLAHELGHILSDHVMYMTALNILLSVASPLPFFLGIPFRAVRAVLLEWYRAAELSCDRAATLAVRDPRIVCRTLMVTAGFMPSDRLNLDAFMTQAMEYEAWDDPSDRVRRFFQEIGQDHTYAVRRVSEIMKWVQTGDYDRIIRGEYRKRDDEANVREEASDAVQFYAERFRTIFREAGDNLAKAGSQIGGVADQLADWVRTRGGPGGFGGGFGGPGRSGGGEGAGGAEGSGGAGGSGGAAGSTGDEFEDDDKG